MSAELRVADVDGVGAGGDFEAFAALVVAVGRPRLPVGMDELAAVEVEARRAVSA